MDRCCSNPLPHGQCLSSFFTNPKLCSVKYNATLILLLIGSLISPGKLIAQVVTLQLDNAEVKTVLDNIRKQTRMEIRYNPELLRGAQRISIHVTDTPLVYAMEHICKGQRFYYHITNVITLIKKKGPEKKKSNAPRGNRLYGFTRNQYGEIARYVCLTDSKNLQSYYSDSRGYFVIPNIELPAKLTITGHDLETTEFTVTHLGKCDIPVKEKQGTYQAYEQAFTGYQPLLKKTTPSSGFVTDADVLDTRTSQSMAERLEGIVPGLLLTTNRIQNVNQPRDFLFTGRTTLAANANPLVIVDNFPSENNLNLVNPDDIEDISFLKDASAASIWGARAANGVMVIRTKSAKNIPRLRVSFNNYVSIGAKPDLFYADQLSSADRIFIDTTLYTAGYFTNLEKSRLRPALSPVVEAKYNKTLTDDMLTNWSKQDNRHDQEKYFYRRSFSHHFSTQVTTGNKWNAFYLSLGYDKTNPEITMSEETRKTLLLNNRLFLLPGLELAQTLSYSEQTRYNTDGIPEIPVPYGTLADDNGYATAFPYLHRYGYIDTVGKGKLLDWKYYPLTEFQLRNKTITGKDVRFQASAAYNNFGKRLKGLEVTMYVQQQVASRTLKEVHDKRSFYVRDLVNTFSQITPVTVNRPIPWGDIADVLTSRYHTFNFRFKVNYSKNWDYLGKLDVMAGRDVMKTRGDSSLSRTYNYSEKNGSGQNALDYNRNYPLLYFPQATKKIPYINKEQSEASYYYSTYVNGAFQYKGKYSLSANGRIDESNLYGEGINGKPQPLLSVGAAWLLNEERFFPFQNIPYLKLRGSYGVMGNPLYNGNAMQTISYAGFNANGDPVASFNNPALTRLGWEKVRTLNLGLNLCTANDRIEASIDWYQKRAKDLISWRLVDPTTGNDFLINNNGAMVSRNVDLIVETKNLNGLLQWNSGILLTYQKDKMIRTGDTLQQAWVYCDPTHLSTVPGKPLYGIYSFPFTGLDGEGNPMGSNNRKDYTTMLGSYGYDSLRYHGRSTPSLFGSFTNNLYWKQFSLSVTLLYKFNYYFRRNSVNYTSIYNGSSNGSADFSQRWQKGKENNTTVPSMPVTATPDAIRDLFYTYSSVLIERGDHIRLQNIHLTYDLGRRAVNKLYLRTGNFYVNCSNPGIVWRANKHKIDPDKLTGYPQPAIFTIGFKGTFK
jgi:TonB-dependent starch-binding outer membrane protein SusC